MVRETFYMGLDLSTSAIGWAVAGEDGHLLRAKGKDLWGVRLFEEAESPKNRKDFRNARRKRARKVMRIQKLKHLFVEEISKKDEGFLKRLEESMLWEEDRSEMNTQPFSLFCDNQLGETYTDVEYHKDYPTIFHLRKELMESKEPHDVRLLYLALLHMFKHRGHFLDDTALSSQTLQKYDFLSEGKVASYEKHKTDLKKLKKVMKNCGDSAYREMFQEMRDGLPNYSAYVNSINTKKGKDRRSGFHGKMSAETKSKKRFYGYMKKVVSGMSGNPDVQEILEEIKQGTFLPKQMTEDNCVIPNWFHLQEMERILENATSYLSFLQERNEEGKTVSEQILSLFQDHCVEDTDSVEEEDIPLPALQKRMIWQAFLLVQEIIKVKEEVPKRIYFRLEQESEKKKIRKILKKELPEIEFIFIPVSAVQDFRWENHLPRVWCINDFHYAQEAYLSMILENSGVNISICQEVLLICQSVTGLFEREVDLLKKNLD